MVFSGADESIPARLFRRDKAVPRLLRDLFSSDLLRREDDVASLLDTAREGISSSALAAAAVAVCGRSALKLRRGRVFLGEASSTIAICSAAISLPRALSKLKLLLGAAALADRGLATKLVNCSPAAAAISSVEPKLRLVEGVVVGDNSVVM